jgi:hypothetical protein
MDEELNDTEERLAAEITAAGQRSSNLGEVALALGAAYGLYRLIFRRRMQEATVARSTPDAMQELAQRIATLFLPRWAAVAAPALATGLILGMREAGNEQPDNAWASDNATRYAERLGDNIHQVSTQAMVDGMRAMMNRKVVARVAAERVVMAFGVTPRTMRALVNVWMSDRPTALTTREVPQTIAGRIDRMIAAAITSRAKAIGESEAYITKNTAKAMYWAYLAQTGQLDITAEKEWVTADDELVCSLCGPMHEARVPVTEDFTLPNGQLVSSPIVHTNCRCDIILVTYAGDIQVVPDDFALVKSAWGVVSKAQAGDRYDRDRKGRFSEVESRRSKVQTREVDYSDPRVAQVLAQAGALLEEPVEVLAPPKAMAPAKSRLVPKARIDAKAQPVKAKAVVGEKAQVAAEAKAEVLAPERAQIVEHNIKAKIRAKIRAKANPTFVAPKAQLEAAEPNDVWMTTPDGQPIYVIMAPYEWDPDQDTVFVDEYQPFYTAGTEGLGISTLQQAVSQYWDSALNNEDLFEDFADRAKYNESIGVPVLEAQIGRHTVFVDYDAYDVATIETVHGITPEHSEHLLLPAYDNETGRPVAQVSVSAHDIAQALAIPMLVENLTPVVGRTNKINVDTFDDDQYGGVITNPGAYRVLSSDIGSMSQWGARDEGVGMPFHMFDIDPDDLYP